MPHKLLKTESKTVYNKSDLNTENKRYGHTAHTFSRLLPDILIWERFYFYKQ